MLPLSAPRQLPANSSKSLRGEAKQLRRHVWSSCLGRVWGLWGLSLLSPSLEWHLISMMSLFHLQLKKLCKMHSQQEAQKNDKIASERCCCLCRKGYIRSMLMCGLVCPSTSITSTKIKRFSSGIYHSSSY